MQTKLSTALAVAFLVFAGCRYNPDGEHFKELDRDGNPPFVEVELNFDTDTLYICNNEWIYFSYKKNGDQVHWARFIIDGKETSPNDEQQGGVELYWYFPGFPHGRHTLSMQLFTRSGTGSIADYTGAEGFLMQKDWVLIITDDWGMVSNVDTTFENGMLKLEWEKFKGLNFERYEVYKFVQPTGLPDQLVATITDQHQTTVIDPDYHGENSSYYVKVNDRYRGNSNQIQGPLPKFSATNNATGDIVLRWEKPPFWAALKGYRILDNDISWTSEGMVPLYLIGNALVDSFVIPDPYFGNEHDFWLQMDPKGTAYYENWTSPVSLASRVTAIYGIGSPKFHWAQTGTENTIYLLDYDGMRIMNTETMEINIPQNFPGLFRFYASANNNYLAGRGSDNNELFLFDLKHPENNKTIDMNKRVPEPGHLFSVSDKGTGIVLSGQKAVLYDYINDKALAEKELEFNGLFQNNISGDGNYFTIETYGGYSWFSCESNIITEMESIKSNESETMFSDFIPGEPAQLVVASSGRVSVYNCKTQELLHRHSFTPGVETIVYHVVKSSGQLFISEGDSLVLLDLITGDRTVLGKSRNKFRWELVYNNGQILWNEGRRMDVNDKL